MWMYNMRSQVYCSWKKMSRYLQKRDAICPAYSPQNSVLRIGPLFVQAQMKPSFKCQIFSSLFPRCSPAPKHINDPAVLDASDDCSETSTLGSLTANLIMNVH